MNERQQLRWDFLDALSSYVEAKVKESQNTGEYATDWESSKAYDELEKCLEKLLNRSWG